MDFLPKVVETAETKVEVEMERKGLTILNGSKSFVQKSFDLQTFGRCAMVYVFYLIFSACLSVSMSLFLCFSVSLSVFLIILSSFLLTLVSPSTLSILSLNPSPQNNSLFHLSHYLSYSLLLSLSPSLSLSHYIFMYF